MPAYKKILLEGDAASLASLAPANVDFAVAAVGIGTTAARDDHKHSAPTGSPSDIGTANASGSSNSIPRLDHVHSHPAIATGDLHTQYILAAGTRAFTATQSMGGFQLTGLLIEQVGVLPAVVTSKIVYLTTDNHLYIGQP